MLVWVVTVHAAAIAVSVFTPDFNHFTWVGLITFGAYAALGCVGVEHYFYWLCVGMQTTVIFGVNIMSYDRCAVFEEAYATNGALMFIVGNFVMHYLPLLVIVAKGTRKHTHCGTIQAFSQTWTGLGIYLSWMYQDSPMEVYGCRLVSTIGIAGILIVVIFMKIIVSHLNDS